MTHPTLRIPLRRELFPLFLVVLGFALGFIFYAQRISPLLKTAEEQYGDEWPMVYGCIQWGIPAAAFAVYLFLSVLAVSIARVADPLRDWNYLARSTGRPLVTDPARKEEVRALFLRALYLFKLVLLIVALFAQWEFFQVVAAKLGMTGA